MTILFLRRFWPFLVAGVLVAALTAGYVHWLHGHDARIRVEQQLAARDTVIQWRTDTAAVRSAERRVDSVTVTRRLLQVRIDTLWRRDTVRLAGDTTARVAIPLGVLEQHDSAFAACDRLNHSCAREHAADSVVILELRRSLALARTGNAVPPPRACTGPAIAAGVLGVLAGHYVR